jgi:hypothetical protein
MPFFLYFFFMVCSLFSGTVMANSETIVYGYIEKATLVDNNLTLSAKLDTGAKSASLNASHIKEIEKNGKTFLSFIVPSKEGDKHFECEYIGKINIKNRAEENQTTKLFRYFVKRPVVLMNVKLGNQIKQIRVNLTNRKHFIYPMLLGREAIVAFNGSVNPKERYIQSKRVHKK